MSSSHAQPKGLVTRLVQASALLFTFGVLWLTRLTPHQVEGRLPTIAVIGFLLLAGTLLSELFETIGLPHLSGYLIAGIVGGPHVLHLVDHESVEALSPVNTLALSLIALAGGAELRVNTLGQVSRSLLWAAIFQSSIVLVGAATVFTLLSRFIPFTQNFNFAGLIGVALLWGVLSITRSPSACLGILAQTKAKGPVATFALAFIMLSDVIVVVFVAAMITVARLLITPGAEFSLSDFRALGHEIVGSIAVGTTLGLVLAAYLRLVGGQLLVVLLAIGFGLSEALHYVHIDPLLAFLTMGFVVQNLSSQGPKLLHAVEQTGSVVFVVFFATAGAHLNVPLLKALWPVALVLCSTRALFTVFAARIASRIAQDPPIVARFGWASLISQAGLTLGISVVIEKAFPSFGPDFRALAIAAVAINELVGPVLFKFSLDRAGETDRGERETRSSLIPPSAEAGS